VQDAIGSGPYTSRQSEKAWLLRVENGGKWFRRKTHLLRWCHIPYQWQGERTQCPYLVNCDWRLISRHVGKLVVTPTEYQLWRLHSTSGRCSPHFHRNVRVLLNCVLQQLWIGRVAKGDKHLLPWPPRSPDLTPCDVFLWGFVKGSVYLPPLPMSLKELRDWLTHAPQTITADMLHRVWDEYDYRVDVSCDPGCTLWRIVINAWETWTFAAADGVHCARVRWEINILFTFETAPFFYAYPVYYICSPLKMKPCVL